MIKLQDEMLSIIADGLLRSSVTTCARWANRYRYMPHPVTGVPTRINYEQHPWSMALRDCNESWIGPKAAQMAYTESCLDRAFYTIDVLKRSVLYLLPKKNPDASDFSASRFDPALEMSPHLKMMFDKVSNVGHKRAGSANLFIRGTMSKSGVKSLPVSVVIFDEKDEMNQNNIAQAEERMSGQDYKQKIEISTPTIPKFGIDKTYRTSNQQHFFFTCPHCNRKTELEFFDEKGNLKCLVVTADSENDNRIKESYIKCKECGNKLDHNAKSEWMTKAMFRNKAGWEKTANKDSDLYGFYINQLYSFKRTPAEIAATYLRAIYDPAVEQELWNSKAGLPHTVDGARVEDWMITNCIGNHSLKDPRQQGVLCTMGVDQGKWIYYHVDLWFFPLGASADINTHARKFTIKLGKVSDFEELDKLMVEWQVNHCVIDANPERRKATEFKERFFGHVDLCFYNRGLQAKEMNVNEPNSSIAVDRTSWLDITMSRYRNKTIILPKDITEEYRQHVKALVRMPGIDPDGNPIAKYINTEPDHFAHASNYSEIALPRAASITSNQPIAAFL